MSAPPENEKRRLELLGQYQVLDTPAESEFNDIAHLAAEICEVPIAVIAFVDEKRVWLKSRLGMDATEIPRHSSFWAQAQMNTNLLVVPDAAIDKRFADHSLVVQKPHIRFYAGAPLMSPDGLCIGTLSVMDTGPRKLSQLQTRTLSALSRQLTTLLELRKCTAEAKRNAAERTKAENLLKESESHYRLLFHDNPHPMWVFDTETFAFLEVNEAAISHYGFSRAEFLSMTIRDIRPPEELPVLAEYFRAGSRATRVWRHRKKDDTLIDVEISWRPISFHGKCAHLVLATDITERRRVEFQNATLASLARNLGKANSAEQAAGIIVEAADKLLGWDASSLDLYVREKDLIIPVLNRDLVNGVKTEVPCAYRSEPPSPNVRKVIDEGGQLILRRANEDANASTGLKPFGNTGRRSKSILFVPIRNLARVIGVLSIQSYRKNAYDSSDLELLQVLADQCGGALERINVEEKLAEERNLLRTLMDHLPDSIIVKDLESRYLFVNKSNEKSNAHGLKNPGDLIGRKLSEFLPAEEVEQFVKDDQLVFRTGQPLVDREEQICDGAGNVQWLLTTKVPLRDKDGRIMGLVGISRDITERRRIETALRESQEMFELISSNVSDLIAVIDAKGRRIYNSPSYREIFGDPTALRGTDSFAQIHPEDRERVKAVFAETLRTGMGRRIEYRFLLPNGGIRHIESQGNFVQGDSPETNKVVVVSRDISDRKRVEHRNAALSRLGQNLSAARSPEEAAQVIREITRELFHWDVFLLTLCSLDDQKIRPILNIDTIDGKQVEINNTKAGAAPSALSLRIIERGAELILKTPPLSMLPDSYPLGDEQRPSASLMFAPVRNGNSVIGILSIQSYALHAFTQEDLKVLQNIADHCGGALERIRAEDALRNSEVRFQSVWENSVDGMRLTDEAGIIIAVNKAFCALVGMERSKLEGQPFTVTYAEADHHDLLDSYKRRFRERTVETFMERTMVLHSGKTVQLEGSNSFVELKGHRPLLLGLFRNVTEQKQLENELRQSQKMDSIGQLAGGIAHDFNNLLTVIQGHASLLLASEKDEATADSLQEISLAAERSANLTRQLLTFSRRQVMQQHPLDLKEVVDEMTKMLRRILGEDIILRVENRANLPRIRADRGMMEQILLNLAVNSRDAMERGGELIISTDTRQIDEAYVRQNPESTIGEFVLLKVTDTGCGISPENLTRIFEPFFTTKEIGRGTGLGLATVYGIVKQHQGWIKVDSEVGKGTTFEVFFPRHEESSEKAGADQLPKTRPGSETILVVEDEEPLRELVEFLLERQGYRILSAHSGVSALRIWEEHKDSIDLLFTDLIMPEGITGNELAAHLQKQRTNLKVIFTSGYSADTVGKDFVLRDGLNFLQKPYHPDKLAQTVRDCLDGK